MTLRIDLHSHSLISDGTAQPATLVSQAAAAGLDVLALTDHDTTAGWQEAQSAAGEQGIKVLPGVEISTKNQGKSQHLLAYGFDPANLALAKMLDASFNSRTVRAEALFEVFESAGMSLDREAMQADVGSTGAPGRAHFGSALVRAGFAANQDEAFELWLNRGKIGYIDRYQPSIEEAIEKVSTAGGVSVIAHCRGRKSAVTEARLSELAAVGLGGIEVWHQEHDTATREELAGIAANLGLIPTGGSDHHGTRKVNHELGVNLTPVDSYERILDGIVLLP